jgi:hypothetical protein
MKVRENGGEIQHEGKRNRGKRLAESGGMMKRGRTGRKKEPNKVAETEEIAVTGRDEGERDPKVHECYRRVHCIASGMSSLC